MADAPAIGAPVSRGRPPDFPIEPGHVGAFSFGTDGTAMLQEFQAATAAAAVVIGATKVSTLLFDLDFGIPASALAVASSVRNRLQSHSDEKHLEVWQEAHRRAAAANNGELCEEINSDLRRLGKAMAMNAKRAVPDRDPQEASWPV